MRHKKFTKKQAKAKLEERIAEALPKHFGITPTAEQKLIFHQLVSTEGNSKHAWDFAFATIFQDQAARWLNSKTRRKRNITEEEFDSILTEAEAQMPALATGLKMAMKEAQKRMPRRGGPGRRGALDRSERLEAVEMVSGVLKIGKTKNLGDIFRAVAKAFEAKGKKVSGRTIKRYWEERASLHEG
ncbi:MAG TPA: hypothetical protein VGU63_07555 [Candidatus Acidoferrales bacterium]|nr:hypothetical protein [Candidatus Acidoferrales bacterium]